jgi:hypothetical protein
VSSSDLILSAKEIETLTDYTQPAAQLRELYRQGFWRARRSKVTGQVILERAHYEAVCTDGSTKKGRRGPSTPELRPA